MMPYLDEEGLTYQEEQAWEKACETLTERDGTLTLEFKTMGSSREFHILYIPLPSKERE
jgi:hypothetical protein